MARLIRWTVFVAMVLLCGAGAAFAGAPAQLDDLLKELPAQDSTAAEGILKAVLEGGKDNVVKLTEMLVEPGKGDDTKVRFALHGLAIYVARPDAKRADRKAFTDAMSAQLDSKLPTAVKGFLIRQLRFAGGESVAGDLGKALGNDELCEYAAQALVSIGGDAATKAMRDALPRAQGKNRLTIVQNLGVMRDAKSVADLMKDAANTDRELRLAALFALGNIGDPVCADMLLKAADAEPRYERAKATDACFLLAKRLTEAKKIKDAERICRKLLESRTATEDRHVRIAALRGLAEALGEKAMPDLIAAMKSDDLQIRTAAVDIAAGIPGEGVTRTWIAQMKDAPPAARAEILGLLARRGDPIALPVALDAIKDADESVRVAAITTAATLGKKEAIKPLVAVLDGGGDRERQAARNALIRIPGKAATDGMALLAETAPSNARAALLGILAARNAGDKIDVVTAAAGDKEENIRVAALDALGLLAGEGQLPKMIQQLVTTQSDRERQAAEKAVISTCQRSNKDRCAELLLAPMADASVPAKCALVRALGRVNAAKSLEAIRAAIKNPNTEVQDAAVGALSDWPDAIVASDLLEIARSDQKPNHYVLAFRGYVRLAGTPKERPAEQKLAMFKEALAVARQPEEKKLALGGLGGVEKIEALKMAAPYLDDEATREEAIAAAMRILEKLPEAERAQAAAELEKIVALSKNNDIVNKAKQILSKIKK